jgi:hypothetical protein
MLPEPLSVVAKLARVFDDLNIAYMVGGSVASSIHGLFRSTQDVDFVADLKGQDVAPLVAVLESEFYVDAEAFPTSNGTT